MLSLLIVGALAANSVSPVLSDLAAQAQRARQAQETDQFAEVPDQTFAVGQAFVLEQRESDVFRGSFLDFYKDGRLQMQLSETSVYLRDFKSANTPTSGDYQHLRAYQFSDREVSRSRYPASNAFGARATVERVVSQANYLAAVELPRGDPPKEPLLRNGGPDLDQYQWSKELPGQEAKQVYTGSKMVMEGNVSRFPDGQVTHCKTFYAEATISAPTEIVSYECFVAVTIRRIAFLAGDGSVLREWKR